MNKELSDIELIRRYHNGTLDKKAMYELERRALDDPFLADAMEGFEHFDYKENTFIELNERLKDRVSKPKNSSSGLGFRHWSLAASIIILIGLISIYLNMPKESHFTEDTSLNTKGQVAASNTSEDSTRHIEIPIIDEKLATIVESHETLKAVITEGENPLPTDIVVESFSPSMPTSSDDPSNQLSLNKAEPADKPSSMIARSATSIALSETTTAAAKDTTVLTNGKVTDVATGMPLLGVVITDNKNGKSYLSNDKGEFSVPEQATSLSFYIPGYETKDVEIKNQTDLQNITLKTFTPVKEEVSLNVPRRKTSAGPKDGWAAFRKYLNINSELESGEIGFVVIEFVIRPNGELSNFKVLKSLSKLADARATDLIKNYQSWVGSPAGAHKVKVMVRFNSIAE